LRRRSTTRTSAADLAALSRRLHELQKELDAPLADDDDDEQTSPDEPFDPEAV